MIKHEIGGLLLKGLTSKEIQKRIKNFPDNPDTEYFINLGYTKKTASTYKYLLKKNTENNAINKNYFIMSKKANTNNIIMDTCALHSKHSIKIINNSKSVTILYATIKEFDTVSKNNSVSKGFKYAIRDQTKAILLSDTNKYRLVPFNWKNTGAYTDEIILEYIETLPASERPTLLTADQNLALRAKCLGFEYILYVNQSSQNESKPKSNSDKSSQKEIIQNKTQENTTTSITNLGVEILYDNPIVIRKHNPSAEIFLVSDDICKNVSSTRQIENEKINYFVVIAKSNKHQVVKVQKIWMENNKKQRKEFKYYCGEKLNPSNENFHSTILDYVQKLL